jgi:hypothetical protein
MTPKCDSAHVVELSDEIVRLLQAHKRTQSELKMKNRTVYQDYGHVRAGVGAP